MIAITFALPAESSSIVGRLRERRVESGDFIYGQIDNHDVAIFHTGVGRKACAHNIDNFLRAIQPKVLISSGFAGSVGEKLSVGDVIVAENFSDPDLVAKWGGRKVKLFTATSIIDSMEERNRVARESGAGAVDMETEVIARACATRGIQMLSLRVISDTPDAPFPLPVGVLFDIDRQKTSSGKLIRHLISHPSAIPRLVRFSRQIAKAREKLTRAIIDVVKNLE